MYSEADRTKISGSLIDVAHGKTVAEPVQKIGATEQTHDRWEKRFTTTRSGEKRLLTSVACSAGNAAANVGLAVWLGSRGANSAGNIAFQAMSPLW
jgi:hypothetical protein